MGPWTQKNSPLEKLLTPREVASWLDVSVDWVQDHATVKEPRIPVVRIGKLLRFRREDVEAFLAERMVRRPVAFSREFDRGEPIAYAVSGWYSMNRL